MKIEFLYQDFTELKCLFRVIKKSVVFIIDLSPRLDSVREMSRLLEYELKELQQKFNELKLLLENPQSPRDTINMLGNDCFTLLDSASDKLYEHIERNPILSFALQNKYSHNFEFALFSRSPEQAFDHYRIL